MALAYGAAGTAVYSTGNPAPSYPAGGTSGKYLYILYVGTKPDSTPATTPSGWTLLGAFSGGAGTTGIDTGPMRVGVFIRESTTVLTGTVTVTVTGNNVSAAWIDRWDMATTEVADLAITGGADATAGAAYSAVTSSVAATFVKTGDGLSVVTITPTDTNPTTWGTPTLTAQGGGTISLGTLTQRQLLTTASGQDMGGRHVTALPTVTSLAAGTLTWATTVTGTFTNHSGPTAIVRVRAVPPPTAPTSAPTVAKPTAEQIAVTTPTTLQGGADSYKIYRDGTTLIASGIAANTAVNDTNQSALTARTYTVRGTNVAGDSGNGPASSSIVPDPAPPAAPILTPSDSAVNVLITKRNYTAVYKVYRGLAGGGRSLVHTSASVAGGGTYSWDNTGLVNGTAYDFHVTTTAETPTSRESANSGIATATPALLFALLPDSTITAGGFTAVPSGTLWEVTDDDPDLEQPSSDYAQAAGSASSPTELGLSDTPAGATLVSARLAIYVQADFFSSSDLLVTLRQGTGTLIASMTPIGDQENGLHVKNLTGPELAAITDPTDLRVSFRVDTAFDTCNVYAVRLTGTYAAGGPVDYTRTPSDLVGTSDTSRVAFTKRIAADLGIQAGQDTTRTAVQKVLAPDSSGLVDSSAKRLAKILAADLAGLLDTQSRVSVIKRVPADTEGLSDVTGLTSVVKRSSLDTLPLTDLSTALLVKLFNKAETEALTDVAARTMASKRSQSDTEALTDFVARLATLKRSPADTEALSDSTAKAQRKAVTDSAGLSDSMTQLLAVLILRAVVDNEALTDSLARVVTYSRRPADTEALTDALVRVHAAKRVATDTEALTDAVTKATATSRAPSDTLVLSDTILRTTALLRAITEAEGLSDTVSVAGAGVTNRTILDAVGLVDTVARQMAMARTKIDVETLSDIILRSTVIKRTAAETVVLTDTASRIAAYRRGAIDAEVLSDAQTYVKVLKRPLAETVGLFDFATPITQLFRTKTDQESLTDTATRRVTYVRVAEDQESLLEAVLSATQYRRGLSDVEVLVDTVDRGLQIVVGVQDDLVLTEAFDAVTASVSSLGFYVWNPDNSLWILTPWAVWHESSQDWVDSTAATDLNYTGNWENLT